VVWTGRFEKFLKMVLRLPRLVLEIMFSGRDILLIGVVSFLVITIVVGRNGDASGVPLLPLLAALGALPSILDGGFGWCCSSTTSGCFHVAQDEGGPNHLLARGVSVATSSSSLVVFTCSRSCS
jgi:hypothetical protein